MRNTGAICMIAVPDHSREEGFRNVDLGNYFTDQNGDLCLITSRENAAKYKNYVDVPIYILRAQEKQT